MKKMLVLGMTVLILSLAFVGCGSNDGGNGDNNKGNENKGSNQTPVASDYNISNLNQIAGNIINVIITAKSGKSPGKITIKHGIQDINGEYNYQSLPPWSEPKIYHVVFDVEAAAGWNAAYNLPAGDLVVRSLWTQIPIEWTSEEEKDDYFYSSINCLVYENNMFFAAWYYSIGSDNLLTFISTSVDGITWTSSERLFDNRDICREVIYDIVWGNNKYIAVGNYGSILTSSDGITWIESTDFNEIYNSGSGSRAITWGNNMFAAVGWGRIAVSPDGETWEAKSTNFNQYQNDYYYNIVYGNNMFVAIGNMLGFVTSSDGENWENTGIGVFGTTYYGSPSYVSDIIFINDKFYALGAGKIAVSSDGLDWTLTENSTIGGGKIAWGNNIFASVGSNVAGDYIKTSSDGITWNEISYTSFDFFDDAIDYIAWGNDKFIAAGSKYKIKMAYWDGVE